MTINLTHAITFPAGAGNYLARSLTFATSNGSASLTHAANQTLTVGVGGVTLNSAAAGNNTKAWNINDGSATVNGNVALVQGSNSNNRIARINLTSGPSPAATLTINGNLSLTFGTALRGVIDTTGGTADGQINLSGTFTVTNGTLNMGAGNAIFNYNGAAAQTALIGASAIVYRNLYFNNSNAGGATLGAAVSAANVTGSLRVQSGILNNGGFNVVGGAGETFQVDNGATFSMTGGAATVFPTGYTTFTFGPTSTVRYLQTGTQTISAQTYGHLEVSPAADGVTHTFAAGTTTVAGDLTAGNGVNTGVIVTAATNNTTLDVNGGVTISANTTLTAHATNAFTIGGNWTNNGTFTNSGATVTLDGAAAQTIGGTSNTTFNNLTIVNTVGGVSLTSSQIVGAAGAGTLTLTSGTFAVGANTLTLNGPTIAGTPTNLSTTAASSLVFGGNAAGVNLPSSVTNLNNLTLDNTNATPQLTLNSGPTLVGTLTLTNGVIVAGTNTLTTSANCPGSIVRTSGWVSGNLRMAFPAGTPNCTFHLGDPTANYTPLQLNFSSVTTAGSLTAGATGTDHPNTTAGTSGISSGVSINRYWALKDSTMAGTATVTFNYIGGIPVDNDSATTPTRIRRATNCTGIDSSRTCAPWLSLTVSGAPTSTQAIATGVAIAVGATAQSDFAVGGLDPTTNFLRERQFIYTRELY